jgi:hypothetical protein
MNKKKEKSTQQKYRRSRSRNKEIERKNTLRPSALVSNSSQANIKIFMLKKKMHFSFPKKANIKKLLPSEIQTIKVLKSPRSLILLL